MLETLEHRQDLLRRRSVRFRRG